MVSLLCACMCVCYCWIMLKCALMWPAKRFLEAYLVFSQGKDFLYLFYVKRTVVSTNIRHLMYVLWAAPLSYPPLSADHRGSWAPWLQVVPTSSTKMSDVSSPFPRAGLPAPRGSRSSSSWTAAWPYVCSCFNKMGETFEQIASKLFAGQAREKAACTKWPSCRQRGRDKVQHKERANERAGLQLWSLWTFLELSQQKV